MSMQIRGILLDGQSCSGKTSVFNALKRCHLTEENAERNIIFLAEHYSQVLNYVNGNLRYAAKEENLKALSERVTMLEQLNAYVNAMGEHSRRSRGLFFVYERFLFTHAVSFDDTDTAEYRKLEERLVNLNTRAVVFAIHEESVSERLKHRDPGKEVTPEDIKNYLVIQQKFLKTAERSNVPTTVIYTDEMNWDAYARQILKDIG